MNCIVLLDDFNNFYKEINIQIYIIVAVFNSCLEPCGAMPASDQLTKAYYVGFLGHLMAIVMSLCASFTKCCPILLAAASDNSDVVDHGLFCWLLLLISNVVGQGLFCWLPWTSHGNILRVNGTETLGEVPSVVESIGNFCCWLTLLIDPCLLRNTGDCLKSCRHGTLPSSELMYFTKNYCHGTLPSSELMYFTKYCRISLATLLLLPLKTSPMCCPILVTVSNLVLLPWNTASF